MTLFTAIMFLIVEKRKKNFVLSFFVDCCSNLLLYNVLLINRYIGNITIKCHSKSMGDNRDPTVVLHQEIYSLPVSIASDTRCF